MNQNNILKIIEREKERICVLDNRDVWEIGSMSKNNFPDIMLRPLTISRKHGKFQNIDGVWYYQDYGGKNGTIYNGKKIRAEDGTIKPVKLSDGDILVLGGGEEPVVCPQTVWIYFLTK